jgi:GNAT superfamily N-acetyltransferase
VTIRVATKDDLPDLLSLCRSFYNSSEWARDTAFEEDAAFPNLWGLVVGPQSTIIVIEDAGKVVGACAVQIAPMPWTFDLVATEVFWYVLPEARRTPASLELFVAAETWARDHGAKVMLMGALVTSPPKVRMMYENAGYRESQTAFIKRLN